MHEVPSISMLLQVGELARRTGLTVRTLHHYDSIGLLKPSARSDAGYRLYSRDDIARLHQVQALQRLGLGLADIGVALASPGSQLAEIITQQLQMLDRQIEQATQLRLRLAQLQVQLLQGAEPVLTDWLSTLELMSMYDKYFSPDELKRIPFHFADEARNTEWAAMVKTVRDLMDKDTPTHSAEAQAAAAHWFTVVERDIAGDARLLAKLTDMHLNEPALQAQTGITPELIHYIQQASTHTKLAIYQKYLSPTEFAYVQENYGKRIGEWPALIAAVRQEMDNGTATDASAVRKLALHWLDLFRSYAGDNPETQAKIRDALAKEPELKSGSLIDVAMLEYMRAAFARLHAR
jgi:DNA-binding transcriptional MerR regulator